MKPQPNQPRRPTLAEMTAARERIAPYIRHTPLIELKLPHKDRRIFVKLETLQPIGAFKLRPALSATARATTVAAPTLRNTRPSSIEATTLPPGELSRTTLRMSRPWACVRTKERKSSGVESEISPSATIACGHRAPQLAPIVVRLNCMSAAAGPANAKSESAAAAPVMNALNAIRNPCADAIGLRLKL